MGITDIALKLAAPLPGLENYKRYLFIGPHPDDIEIGAGATAAKLIKEGKEVCFLICTDGRFGTVNAPEGLTAEALAAMREKEALASAAMLGVHDVRFLRFCDGGFYEYASLLRAIAAEVGSFKPEVIFCPDPDVISECHIDHLNAGRAGKQLALFAPYEDIMRKLGAEPAPVQAVAMYMTAKPNRYVDTSGYLNTQLSSVFDCHVSQFPEGSGDRRAVSLYIRLRAHDFGIRRLRCTAEGFRVLGATHMHCLPEAGK